MTDRRLAIDAWESLFRAQHEVFGDVSGDFDATALSQAEYDVTANMLISQPSVSRLVDRMVARGLLSKCADPDDGRGALVRATDEGAAVFRRIASSHGRAISERMSVLSDSELAQLRELTAKLRKQQPDC